MTYGELQQGAWFRITAKPHKLWQKLEWCACSMEWNVMRFRDDVEVTPEPDIENRIDFPLSAGAKST